MAAALSGAPDRSKPGGPCQERNHQKCKQGKGDELVHPQSPFSANERPAGSLRRGACRLALVAGLVLQILAGIGIGAVTGRSSRRQRIVADRSFRTLGQFGRMLFL